MMLIGKTSSGKTTLAQYLHDQELVYIKTQSVQLFGRDIIDIPGEYLEVRGLRNALIVTAADADIIAFVQDASDAHSMFSPQFSSRFTKPVIGIVTKTELADDEEIAHSTSQLKLAGAGQVFLISCLTGEGLEELDAYLRS